ncbi:hypothetical protein LINGRAHAP2_LOCUS14816, partial [Linum grandiflorum]
ISARFLPILLSIEIGYLTPTITMYSSHREKESAAPASELHDQTTTAAAGRHQPTVAEQIAALTIEASLLPLALTDLVTEPPQWGYELGVVGAFLTKRSMNIHAIRRSLPSVWEPGRGVEVDELEGGLFIFRFEHQLDVRKVMDKGPWHFNGVLLVVHELQPGEAPDQVPLTQIPFWVQMSACQERLVTLHGGREAICRFMYERLHTFCFICGILGHKEQQCELRYRFPEDQFPLLWDDSIKAVSRQEARAQTANPRLRVRNRIEPGRTTGQDAQGRERGRYHKPVIPADIQALAICMGANAWDKDKHIAYPQRVIADAVPLNLDEKKRCRTEEDASQLTANPELQLVEKKKGCGGTKHRRVPELVTCKTESAVAAEPVTATKTLAAVQKPPPFYLICCHRHRACNRKSLSSNTITFSKNRH